ncbi:MAG: hypothetical protein KJZ56_11020 [Flavobacteriales bacterium]|nr:hypothetical protein [Flavobacteriales bacterium]
MKTRLKHKIYESLCNDNHILRHPGLDENIKQSIRLRKKLVQFIVLYNLKGKSEIALNLLDFVIRKAKGYELYPLQVDALMHKIGLLDYSKDKKEQKEYYALSKELTNSIRSLSVQTDVYNAFNKLRIYHAEGKPTRFITHYLYHSTRHLEKMVKDSHSGLSLYFFYLMKINYFENIKKYTQAANYCNKLTELVKNTPSVYRKNRLASAYWNSSAIYIYAGKYDLAIEHAKKALLLFPAHSVNSLKAMEFIFYAAFYSQKYKTAYKYLLALQHSKVPIDEFEQSKYIFWGICLQFTKGNYASALKQLLQKQIISRDKMGWDWQSRILQIQCFIELHKLEEAENAIQTLRQYIWRNDLLNENVSKRQKHIYFLLQKLAKNGFQYKHIKPPLNKHLLLITKRNAWEPLGAELIPFDVWLKKKLKR